TSNDKVVFEGKYFNLRVDPIYPKPKPIPIWIGGSHSQRVYERVAKYGEGLVTGGSPQEFQESMNKITALLGKYGRQSVKVKLGRQTFLCLAKTNDQAKHLTNYT